MVRRECGQEPGVAGESEDGAYELAAAEVEEEEFVGAAVGVGCLQESR